MEHVACIGHRTGAYRVWWKTVSKRTFEGPEFTGEEHIKGKVRPREGHKGLERDQMYGSTLSLTSALYAGGWLTQRPGRFTSRKEDNIKTDLKEQGLVARTGFISLRTGTDGGLF